jgi:hypothetical protein
MHLHGHKFWIVAQGHGWFVKDKVLAEHTLDSSNPMRRDTASAGTSYTLFPHRQIDMCLTIEHRGLRLALDSFRNG